MSICPRSGEIGGGTTSFRAALEFHAARLKTRMFTVLNQPPPGWPKMWLCETGRALGEPPMRDRSIMPE